MGIWLELGIFGLVIAFGLWQIHDVKRAREATRRQRAQEKEKATPGHAPAAPADGQGPDTDATRPHR